MLRTPDFSGLLSPRQIRAIGGASDRINILDGPVRSGKTVSTLWKWLIYCATGPDGELLLTGKNSYSVYRNLIIPLQDPAMFGELAAATKYTAGSPYGTTLGRRFHVIGANDARAENRLRGFTIAGALADEVVLIPQEFFRQLLARMSVPNAQLFGTTNPDSPFHWLKTDFIDKSGHPDMRLVRHHFRLGDNPSLSDEYKRSLNAEYTGMLHRRMVQGEWTAAEGVIYDMFDPDRHVVADCPLITKWLCAAIDYGTVNPFHVILLGIGADRRLYVVAEWRWDSRARHGQLTDAEYAVKLREWLGSVRVPGSALRGVVPEHVIVDPSATSFIAQLNRDNMRPAKADNSVLDGIRTVSSLLASGRLLIHASCEHLLRELTTYIWDEKKQLQGEDAPVKRDDHACDALRYGVFSTRSLWQSRIIQTGPTVNPQNVFQLPGGW